MVTETPTPTYRTALEVFAHLPEAARLPEGMALGFRAVHPDLRSSNGFRYPWPGGWAEVPEPEKGFTTGPCPAFVGDGLCIAKTFVGAAAGGIPAITILLVAYDPITVLGSDDDKLRVARMLVLDVIDLPRLVRQGDLRGADLGGAYLGGADLRGADLEDLKARGALL